jgi:cell division protein FtsL
MRITVTGVLVAMLLLANVVTGIGVVYARHQHRQLFVQLSRAEQARDALNIEFGRLQLEQATWAESTRIEQVARQRLGLRAPEPGDIELVRP